jgi:hypothetical protein
VAWVIWLLVPVIAPVLVALVIWVRGRPRRLPTTDEAMREHAAYLDALGQTARSRDRGPYAAVPAGSPAEPPAEPPAGPPADPPAH